ncbi:unnamed protein product [Phyllotreta striolata]|uniref:Methyltransferase type 11 domain-containing protein n=1 Tax=Phyllotreta striolata TaxID=444603 RepID=A0A9N9XPT6_PHYSR|nr:unnamed protein product [Phyllotreta striolata]
MSTSGMVNPKLWSISSNFSLVTALAHLEKYKHFIKWKPNASILEIGFANGFNSSRSLVPMLPHDYKEFIATDISQDMLEDARESCVIPRSSIMQMDVTENIPNEFRERFDHIFSFFTLHRVKNPRKAFENVHKMLKPNGMMFLSFFERSPVDDIFVRLAEHPKWCKYKQDNMVSTYFHSESPRDEYIRDLEAASFKNYLFNVETESYSYSSEKEFDDSLIAVNGILPHVEDKDYNEYIQDYLDEKYRSQVFRMTNKNGTTNVSFSSNLFVVIASKS